MINSTPHPDQQKRNGINKAAARWNWRKYGCQPWLKTTKVQQNKIAPSKILNAQSPWKAARERSVIIIGCLIKTKYETYTEITPFSIAQNDALFLETFRHSNWINISRTLWDSTLVMRTWREKTLTLTFSSSLMLSFKYRRRKGKR